MRVQTTALAAVGMLALGVVLVGCAGEVDSFTSGMADVPYEGDGADRLGDVPQECIDAMPYVITPADWADMKSSPVDWPEPPAEATLCMTAGGSDLSSATFVTQMSFDEVAAHYEAALSSTYEVFRVSGEENGTGYDAVDGSDGAFSFQVRENDAGFVVVLVAGDADAQ